MDTEHVSGDAATDPRTAGRGTWPKWAPVVLAKITEGCTYAEAAAAVCLSDWTIQARAKSCPEFAAAVAEAREAGRKERTYRLWLRHPHRGKRPPTGAPRAHGGKPRYTYGRR